MFPPSVIVMPPLSLASDRLLADFKDLSVKGSNLFSQINAKIVKLKAEGEKTSKTVFNSAIFLYIFFKNTNLLPDQAPTW